MGIESGKRMKGSTKAERDTMEKLSNKWQRSESRVSISSGPALLLIFFHAFVSSC
jgi:hypothetical protein